MNPDINEETPLIRVEIPQAPRIRPISLSLIKITVVMLIFSFVFAYLFFEVETFYSDKTIEGITKTILWISFLTLTFFFIVAHIIRFVKHLNHFFDIEFNNNSMIVAMILISLLNLVYYTFNFIDIATTKLYLVPAISTFSELLFVLATLPFVIICVHFKVRPNLFSTECWTRGTILMTIAGCFIIFIKRVCTRIKRDANITLEPLSLKNDTSVFIHLESTNVLSVLELFVIVYILICLILLIDPFRNVAKEREDINQDSLETPPKASFIMNLSLVRYRLPTLFLSLSVIVINSVVFYLLFKISNSENINKKYKDNIQVIFLSVNIGTYIIGIIYGIIYYIFEISLWPPKQGVIIKKDQYFNVAGSVFQLFSSGIMIMGYVYHQENNVTDTLFAAEICHNVLISLQVIIQAICISSATYKDVPLNIALNWKVRFIPALFLASINVCFMIISAVFSQNDIFYLTFNNSYRISLISLKDVAFPFKILNRLHGSTFFINLFILQWPINEEENQRS